MTLVKHELKQGKILFMIWTAAIGFLLVICVFLFPEMKGQMESVNDVFASMGSFTEAFGMDRLNFGSLVGFYAVECGNVLGLGGAFYAALNNPSMYNTAFSYSGLLNILERYDNPQGIDMFPVFGSRDDLINNKLDLYSLIDAYAKENEKLKASDTQYNDTKFVMTCGLQDPRIHMSCEFNNALSAAGINTSYYETDGGHNWEYWDRCIKNTIDYIYNAKGAEWRSLCR